MGYKRSKKYMKHYNKTKDEFRKVFGKIIWIKA